MRLDSRCRAASPPKPHPQAQPKEVAMRTLLRKILVVLLAMPAAALAAGPALPGWFNLAPGMTVKEVAADERYGEANVPTPKDPKHTVRGRHWEASAKIGGVDGETPGKDLWDRWKPAFVQGGWTIVEERKSNPFAVSLKLAKGREAWASITLFAPDDIRFDVVEVGENRLRLKLPAPAAKPETIKDDGVAIPFLPPPPGAKFSHASKNETPLLVMMRDKDGEARSAVASGSIAKYYRTPKDLSNLDFAIAYSEALQAAGWTLPAAAQGRRAADGLVVAHYGANGHDLWAVLTHGSGEAAIEVGDAGRVDLAQSLKKDCRVTLVGVLFDFDKATLKPESNAALARAQGAIAANRGLALDVEGHTDAVGNDAYNQKLSEARAQSVVAWLVAKGIPKEQLAARGYGKARPVATNDTDEGRARNRRVDLACRK